MTAVIKKTGQRVQVHLIQEVGKDGYLTTFYYCHETKQEYHSGELEDFRI